ncbi:MAG: hypothetical protein JO254_10000, partial [Pseudolabrys sp.]|nr:hypothetical protein [Pseudolabrys sp.]
SVKLAEAAPLTGGLRFDLAEAASAPPRGGHKPRLTQHSQKRRGRR